LPITGRGRGGNGGVTATSTPTPLKAGLDLQARPEGRLSALRRAASAPLSG
jgi:hypothetical protein